VGYILIMDRATQKGENKMIKIHHELKKCFLNRVFGKYIHVYEGLYEGTITCNKGDFDYWLNENNEWEYHSAK
jgi:hypothetical protein